MPGGIHPPQELLAQWVLRHNYEDPFQRSGLIPIIVIFTIFSILMVSARMYVRGYMQRNLGLDDWVLIAAMVGHGLLCMSAATVLTIYSSQPSGLALLYVLVLVLHTILAVTYGTFQSQISLRSAN